MRRRKLVFAWCRVAVVLGVVNARVCSSVWVSERPCSQALLIARSSVCIRRARTHLRAVHVAQTSGFVAECEARLNECLKTNSIPGRSSALRTRFILCLSRPQAGRHGISLVVVTSATREWVALWWRLVRTFSVCTTDKEVSPLPVITHSTPDRALQEAIAVAKVRAVEESIEQCFRLKQEVRHHNCVCLDVAD